ncbi:MAG: hypothetical protein M0Z63_13195 [Actinomycetota bacterium]|jgi:hypothetical protein|nr:hypothetical protein [Actinomycetota bacterium]
MGLDVQGDRESDDPAIADDDRLYRRLSDNGPNMIAVDVLTGALRPSSGAFKPDDDGVSVYRESLLQRDSLTPADVVRAPQNLVVALRVGAVRSIRPLGVRDDPWPAGIPDEDHPRNAAHALIKGWDGLTTSERRRRQKALAELPSLEFIYP